MVCKVSCMQKANWVVYSGITEFKRDLSHHPQKRSEPYKRAIAAKLVMLLNRKLRGGEMKIKRWQEGIDRYP